MALFFIKFIFTFSFFCLSVCEKHDCENKRNANIYQGIKGGKNSLITIKVAFEGDKLRLPCKYCDEYDSYDIVWKKRKLDDINFTNVTIDDYYSELDNRIVKDKWNSLLFRSVKTEDSGVYICYDAQTNELGPKIEFLVDVQNPPIVDPVIGTADDFDAFLEQYVEPLNVSFTTEDFPIKFVDKYQNNETLYLDTSKYLVVMEQLEWTRCEPCGSVNGEQRGVTHCRLYQIVQIISGDKMIELPQPNVGCRSKLFENIPKFAKKLMLIPDFVEIRSCRVNCSEVIAGENITFGKQSVFGEFETMKVKLRQLIQRYKRPENVTAAPVIEAAAFPLTSLVEFEGTRIKLRCPGVVTFQHVDWYFNYHLLDPKFTELQTKGRVKMEPTKHRLSFDSLKQSDSGIYNCLVSGVYKGNIELEVVKYTSTFDLRSPIGAMKCATIAFSILYLILICIRIMYRRNK